MFKKTLEIIQTIVNLISITMLILGMAIFFQNVIAEISGYEINFYLILGIEVFLIVISMAIKFLWDSLDHHSIRIKD